MAQPRPRMAVSADSLYSLLTSQARPPVPPALDFSQEEFEHFVQYALTNEQWFHTTETVLNLISTALVPSHWPDEILSSLRNAAGDGATSGVCGRVWKQDELAYKCKTCERDPTCVVCVPCFRGGNHEGHDFAMIRTAGGCCDCGDAQAWRPEGFCKSHNGATSEHDDPTTSLPPALRQRLVSVVQAVSLQLLSTTIDIHLSSDPASSLDPTVDRLVAIVEWLTKVVHCGDSFRRLVGIILTNETSFEKLLASPTHREIIQSLLLEKNANRESHYSWISLMLCVDGVDRLPVRLQHTIHGLYFELITDLVFKRVFLERFVENYERFIHAQVARRYKVHRGLLTDEDIANGADIVENFSVQLFTVPALVPVMTKRGGLLDTLVHMLLSLFEACATPVDPYDSEVPTELSAFARNRANLAGCESVLRTLPTPSSQNASPSTAESTLDSPTGLRSSETQEDLDDGERDVVYRGAQQRSDVTRRADTNHDRFSEPRRSLSGGSAPVNGISEISPNSAGERSADATQTRILEYETNAEGQVHENNSGMTFRESIAHDRLLAEAEDAAQILIQAAEEDEDVSEIEEELGDENDEMFNVEEVVLEVGRLVEANLDGDVLIVETLQDDSTRSEDTREGREGADGFDRQQLAVFEEGLSFHVPDRLKIQLDDPGPSRFRSEVASAREKTAAASDGSGEIVHPMRLDWSREQQISMEAIFWRVVIDLKYVLSHASAAFHFVHEREDLFRTLVRAISMAQGMNPSRRQFGEHVAVEIDTWPEAFKLEIELYHLIELLAVAFCKNSPPGDYSSYGSNLHACKTRAERSRLRSIRVIRKCLDEWIENEQELEARSTYARETFSVSHGVSVHLPLHRFLGLFVHHAIRVDDIDLETALSGAHLQKRQDEYQRLLLHPLRIQVFLAQVRAGMWRRNGRPVVGQSMFYRSLFCSEWYVDLDLFMQQCCVICIGPDAFMDEILNQFRVADIMELVSLSYSSSNSNDPDDDVDQVRDGSVSHDANHNCSPATQTEKGVSGNINSARENRSLGLLPMAPQHLQKKGMFRSPCIPGMGNTRSELAGFAPTLLEELLVYIVRIICERTRCGQGDSEFLRRKLLHQLCSRDRTHSQLHKACPYRICNNLENKENFGAEDNSSQALIEDTLSAIADYIQPKGLESGRYTLKPDMWKEFDPFTPHLSPKERCAAEVRHAAVQKERKSRLMAIPEDRICSRGTYTQFRDLQSLLVHTCGINGIAVVVLRELMLKTRLSHSAEGILAAALHLVCATAESLGQSEVSRDTVQWLKESSREDCIFKSAVGLICRMNCSAGNAETAVYTDLRPVLQRILGALNAAGNESTRALLHSKAWGAMSSAAPSSDGTDSLRVRDPEEERRKRLLRKKKEQQAAAMAQMRAAQARFAEHISSEPPKTGSASREANKSLNGSRIKENIGEKGRERSAKVKHAKDRMSGIAEDFAGHCRSEGQIDECALCHEPGGVDGTRLIGLVGFYQHTNLPQIARSRSVSGPRVVARKSRRSEFVPNGAIRGSSDDMEIVADKRDDVNKAVLLERADADAARTADTAPFLLNSEMLSKGVELSRNWHVSFCGHALHLSCFEGYFLTLLQSRANRTLYEGYNILDLERVEFLCPVCRRLANLVLPLMHTFDSNLEEESAGEMANMKMFPRAVGMSEDVPGFHASFSDWVKERDTVIRNLVAFGTRTGSSPTAPTIQPDEERQSRERSGSAFRESLMGRVREVFRRFRLDGTADPRSPLGRTVRTEAPKQARERLLGCSIVPSAAISSAACTEIAARSTPWDSSTLHQARKSLGHVLREARAQIRLEPESQMEALKLVWDYATSTLRENAVDPFACYSFLFMVWPQPLRLSEVMNLAHLVLLLLINQESSSGIGHSEKIETSVNAEALVFLRRAAVLVSSYFDMDAAPPIALYESEQRDDQDDAILTEYLNLLNFFNIKLDSHPRTEGTVSRSIASSHPKFKPVKVGLIKLPDMFQSLLEDLDGEPCVECRQIPEKPALCLVCGSLICSVDGPCKKSNLSTHAKKCGAGIGVFLLLKNTRVHIIRKDRGARWGSPYLDSHGEEDQYLSRGKPLFLNKDRYSVLEDLWLFHGFDQDYGILSLTQTIPRTVITRVP